MFMAGRDLKPRTALLGRSKGGRGPVVLLMPALRETGASSLGGGAIHGLAVTEADQVAVAAGPQHRGQAGHVAGPRT